MSTKKHFLITLNKAFANNDTDYLADFATDDIQWSIIGEETIIGKPNFTKALNVMKADEPFHLNIDDITVHNQKGIVEGTMTSPKGETYAFCDIYVFSNTADLMVEKMTSYVITLKKNPATA